MWFSLFKLDTVSVNSRNKDELHRRWLVHLCKLVWSSIFSWYKNSFFMALTYFKRFFILMTMNAAYFSIDQLMIGLVLQHPRSYPLLLSKLHFFSTIWTVKFILRNNLEWVRINPTTIFNCHSQNQISKKRYYGRRGFKGFHTSIYLLNSPQPNGFGIGREWSKSTFILYGMILRSYLNARPTHRGSL